MSFNLNFYHNGFHNTFVYMPSIYGQDYKILETKYFVYTNHFKGKGLKLGFVLSMHQKEYEKFLSEFYMPVHDIKLYECGMEFIAGEGFSYLTGKKLTCIKVEKPILHKPTIYFGVIE